MKQGIDEREIPHWGAGVERLGVDLLIPPDAYRTCVTAEDMTLEDDGVVILKGTRLVDLFPDGIFLDGSGMIKTE